MLRQEFHPIGKELAANEDEIVRLGWHVAARNGPEMIASQAEKPEFLGTIRVNVPVAAEQLPFRPPAILPQAVDHAKRSPPEPLTPGTSPWSSRAGPATPAPLHHLRSNAQ
jgi:hypothetical protein